MQGKFIVFEGTDGSGKTTQIRQLEEHLRKTGFSVITTREPGGTKISEAVRNILLDVEFKEMSPNTEAFLYASARSQHVEELIKPALRDGKIVICDRFVDSTLAYQGYGRNLDMNFLRQINELATSGLRPDLTIILDLEPALAKGRIRESRNSGEDRIEMEKIEFHQRVRQGFLDIAKADLTTYKVIDANLEITEIRQQVIEIVERVICDGA